MINKKALPRRTFLRGMGTAVALPFLDAMVPALAAPRSSNPPVRMAFVYVPNGIIMDGWNPDYEGKLGELPRILKPLEPYRQDITLFGNLTHNTGRALLDGAGDHGRCCASYLTGVQPRTPASSTNICPPFARSSGRSKMPRRTTRRSIRIWRSRTASPRISRSTSE